MAPVLRYLDQEALRLAADLSPGERAMLDTVNQKVAGGKSLADIMDFLFDQTRSICACDRMGLAFVEEPGGRVVSHWNRALYEPVLLKDGYAEDLQGSSLQEVIERGAVRVISGLERYLADHPASRSTKLLVREGIRSSMTCPLRVEDRNVGLLFRSSRQPNAYGEREVALHLAVAERLSQAVEKACRIGQLAAANRAYMEMLGFVAHELKSPVASIVMDGRVLLEGYRGELQPQQKMGIEKIIHKGEYLLGLVREYLDLARLEGGDAALTPRDDVDLAADVIAPAVEIVQALIDEKHMALLRQLPEQLLRVQCDPDLLRIVLVNLLGNAAKYGREHGEIRLRAEKTDRAFSVSVWNQGPGFPEAERPRLFRKFSRLQTPELLAQKGTGVGLYTCWRIIQLHGGKLRAESEPGSWAEFRFVIPQPLEAEPT
jgi:hypothetical protein